MSEKLPRLTAKEITKALEKLGFKFSRQTGSHRIYKSNHGQRVTVPFHASKILHPKILKSILKDVDINIDELKKIL